VQIVLVNAGDQILKGVDPALMRAATRRLSAPNKTWEWVG
jgi:NADH dehydrogenase FAD-containing subunit